MRYGYFDDASREYVIENPATPMSWVNYLGTAEYCGIISNNAAGYAFYQSAKTGRLLRFRFNSIPMDRPGRYIYLRDNEDGDYWSASWQPVGKPLTEYKSLCRHGLGYTVFTSEYRGISTHYRVFVPVDRPVEFWEVEITNHSDQVRDLSLFAYAEWCFWHMDQDLTNFQYILYTCRLGYEDGIIDYSIRLWPNQRPQGFMASILPVESFDTDRDEFIGRYRHEGNPYAVERGQCANSIAIGGNPCGALQNRLTLAPGEQRYALFIVGIGAAGKEGAECKKIYSDRRRVDAEFTKLQEYWAKRITKLTCHTPSVELNSMVNIWNQYQCHTTFNWSRSASFNEAGGRDGLGYRDTNQDILGVVHAIPAAVRDKLTALLKGQLSCGAALHSVQPLSWKQGRHNRPPEDQIYSDDHLWLLLSVPAYLKETGDLAYLEHIVAYADEGAASVYEHLKQALEFSWTKRGPHGLLLGLAADWNDCINLQGQGESIWSTFLYYKGLTEFITLAEYLGRTTDVAHFTSYRAQIKQSIDDYAWDGRWFLRGYLDSGRKLGGQESEQAKIFINAQTWAVLAGVAERERLLLAMDSLQELLATEYGILKNYPAYREHIREVGAITDFPPGLKENAAIFCHTNAWAVIAEALLGRGDRAFAYYLSYLPATKNDHAELYTMEPYVYAQFITGKEHPSKFGQARNSWLTGTAAWSFVAVTQYLLGIRAAYEGLIIDPVIPSEWDGFTVTREFRGRKLAIKVSNPDRVSQGVARLLLNGERLPGGLVPLAKMKEENLVEVVLGAQPVVL
ncbi:MAG: glycosyl transferase [Firmicutes bacterium]|nr:glycosyl transferase [Bacillota bacterium]